MQQLYNAEIFCYKSMPGLVFVFKNALTCELKFKVKHLKHISKICYHIFQV